MPKKVLVEERPSIPASTDPVRVRGLQKGQQVQLKRGGHFGSADFLACEYWPAGTIGELLGQDKERFVVLFEGERFHVEPEYVRPMGGQQSQEEQE